MMEECVFLYLAPVWLSVLVVYGYYFQFVTVGLLLSFIIHELTCGWVGYELKQFLVLLPKCCIYPANNSTYLQQLRWRDIYDIISIAYSRNTLHVATALTFHPSQIVTNGCMCASLSSDHSRETWGRITKLMGGPEGEFPALWFANRGLAPLSFPCNRGSGLWSLPSPPVRGRTKCTDCTLCVLVKARLPSLWRLGTGKEDRGPRCGWTSHLWLFSRTFSIITGIVEGTSFKSTSSSLKVLSNCGRPTMEMQKWSTRWKTKRWFMDSTVTAFITLTLVLQATHVRAGKTLTNSTRQRRPAGKTRGNWWWRLGD